ncbi:(2Fe-2S) ferredoxin domain-containing protein [Pontibacter liquoris]|uniref:(2Fe-2S) ferredoxin domain-containing protein n=1 Tax=Pontibacter liquoris TaxID=2905677 RepID=UPI001FA76063|nr:(2Fe-2S) ferredoxin domain-containing protein [Pontibacter liquoris]
MAQRLAIPGPKCVNHGMSKSFNAPDKVIYVCTGSKCKKKGGKDLSKLFRSMIKEMGLKDKVEVIKTDCTDRCDFAPVVAMQPDNAWLPQMTDEKAKEAFQEHIIHRNPKEST